MQEPSISVRDLYKHFGETHAVDGVSFQIARGEIFSLLGPNGAGKTTALSILSGLLPPTRGEITIAGHAVTQNPLEVKRSIGVVPQEVALYEALSARENLIFWGRMAGLRGTRLKSRLAACLEIAGLTARADQKVATFSGGMKRRLNVAVGLLHEPKILLLDEPTVGIDPQSRRRILDTILDLNRQGLTVLYTTHYMDEAQEISDRIGIMDHGKLIAIGTLGQLTQMVGQHDTLQLDLETDGRPMQALAQDLESLPQVTRAYGENGYLVLQSPDANQALPAIISLVNRRGVNVRRLEIQEPNLEAVFLHLTGRALRD